METVRFTFKIEESEGRVVVHDLPSNFRMDYFNKLMKMFTDSLYGNFKKHNITRDMIERFSLYKI